MNRLEDRGLVEFGDAEVGIGIVTRVLSENFRMAEAVMAEARERLGERSSREPSEEELRQEMARIAAERGLVL
ncbi:MAG TPA: hypothetical protein VM534_00265 [Thermoanaerobaculia bacterium]|nr:hypothetical protein [Thermoanaerobaculia bacterium]